MQGAVFPGDSTVRLMDFPDPTPGPGEVVLGMKASGICGSDLKHYRGAALSPALAKAGQARPVVIAGHEPCGVVAAVGAGVDEQVAREGDRMMVHHYKGCGCCTQCFTGWTHNCRDFSASYGNNAHGGHARYLKVPASTLVRLPDALSYETGAAISCGSGTAYGALKRADFSARDTLLVVGQGPVGLAVTQFASDMGAQVIAMDLSPDRLQTARSFGAHTLIDPKGGDVVAAVREATGGLGASVVIETSGSAAGGLDAVRCAATWGRVVFVGMGAQLTLDVSEHIIRKQLNLIGSWTFSRGWQADCAAYVERRKLKVDRLFTHRWSLEQADEAYKQFASQATGKAVIVM